MKKIALILCLICSFYSCKSTKHSKKSSRNTTTVSTKSPGAVIDNDTRRSTTEIPNISEPNSRNVNFKVAENIIDYAMKFEGVRYKYGGTDRKGMDCSGLVTTAFSSEGISLPRSSSQIALSGDWIDLKLVQPGDLMFFATNGKNRNITHVALVTHVNDGQVEFIHSTTKAGVIVSSLADRYWYFAFVQARRVL
ncbi:C40 family peptidase [Subsaxibacter sp. CAU 1640]|uniref:C40 family peptidase n=1 Tax=Subsaxibacter sp. CAU 1640 TaxID=2933271 RepID=UPI00200655CC|nr:C40 family peptidase [Subsaxibacter sp. CAU 1640]MCK7590275.1 C40 family peptidase [Subsaxibacter sp. CAU 1640]